MENTSNLSKATKPLLRRGLGRPFLTHLPAWIRNKYFIALAAFVTILFFLDKNDLFTQFERREELRKLQQSKTYYGSQIAAERKELEALKSNPATLEKYAREKYLMKRDDEDLYILSEKPDNTKN